MFERLDDEVRLVIRRGWQRARERGLPTVASEHLLIALAESDRSRAGRVLADAGLTSERLDELLEAERARALRSAGVEPLALPRDTAITVEPVRYATSAKNALRQAVEHARARSKKGIDAPALLRGILEQEAGTAPRMVALAGIDRAGLVSALNGSDRP